MKTSIFYMLLIVLLVNNSFASHIAGGHISYSCLGANQYLIKLTLYRDCSGVSSPTSAIMNISSQSCGNSLTHSFPRVSLSNVNICLDNQSRCMGGNLPDYEIAEYESIVTMPNDCPDWIISYDICCRNDYSINLNNITLQNLYIEALLNNTNGLCNNSPAYNESISPFICVNMP